MLEDLTGSPIGGAPTPEPNFDSGENGGGYHFFTGAIDDFQQEFSAPKQNMNIDEEPDTDPEPPQPTTEERRELGDRAQRTAQFITSVGDTLLANGLAWLDKSGDPEPHRRADDPLMADLENAISYYCERVGGEIPPSVMIIICVMMLYGVQVPQALHDRHEREKQEQLEKANKNARIGNDTTGNE
jgi:hypothetical protein